MRANASAMASPRGKRPISRPEYEQGQPQQDQDEPDQHVEQLGKGLAQHGQLKDCDDQYDRGKVPGGAHHMQSKSPKGKDSLLPQ